MQLSVSLLALFAAAVSSTAIPRASSKCYTVHKGYLVISIDLDSASRYMAVGLNKKKQVTYGAGDSLFKVEFQSCPKLPQQSASHDFYKGRIIVSGTNNCVTVTNPNGSDPFFLVVKKCGSNVIPPASQQWNWGSDYDDPFVYWRGKSGYDEIGYTIDDQYNPVTESGTHRLELGCSNSCASLAIRPKSQLG